jgi:hypothetical protein
MENRLCFLVNLRDRLACRNCGRAARGRVRYHRGFEFHHIVGKAEGGADSVENVVLLCHDCHLGHHQGKIALPPFGDLTPPESVRCPACGTETSAASVEMNCGWFACPSCHARTHLFDYFYR